MIRWTINLLDSEEEIREKVKKAITDSESSVSKDKHSKQHGAISNLLTIYSAFSDLTFDEALNKFDEVSYLEFKQKLADLLVEKLNPTRERYHLIRSDEKALREVLGQGRDFAISESSKTLQKVKQAIGLE